MTVPSIDTLRRPSGKNYSGTASSLTPNVTYCYDGQIYISGACTTTTRGGGGPATDAPHGQLTGYGSQVDGGDAAQNYLHIDPLGRILKSIQRINFPGTNPSTTEYPFIYSYQASGSANPESLHLRPQ